MGSLDAFERGTARYDVSSANTIDDEMRIGIVLTRSPESQIKNHLILNSERLRSWAQFREEIVSIRRVQMSSGHVGGRGGPSPMGIGALGSQSCYMCGGRGHLARDCWGGRGK